MNMIGWVMIVAHKAVPVKPLPSSKEDLDWVI